MDEVWWAFEDLYNDELSKIEHEGQQLEEEFLNDWEHDVPEWHEFETAPW